MPELSINNRTLIPVRLIPFATGWSISPDALIQMLSKSSKWHRVYIPSYHLLADKSYQAMLPKEWDVFMSDMDILDKKLHVDEQVEGENYPAWRNKSIEIIPANTFVWVDEFEAAYTKMESHIIRPGERPGDRELNLQPYMTPEMRKIVFEDFDLGMANQDYTNFTPQHNQTQTINISFNELLHYMQIDPFYGNHSVTSLSILNNLYKKNGDNDLFQRFDKRFSLLPCKTDHVRHLIYFWCGLMQLPTYLNGSPTNWQRDDFLDNWMTNFGLNLGELKNFLRANNWPLPVKLFPNEIDNTQRKVSLDEAEFENAFNDFVVKLPKLIAELAELEEIKPANMEERRQKKEEIANIEEQIAEIHSGTKENETIHGKNKKDLEEESAENIDTHPLAVFRSMNELRFQEIKITIDPDTLRLRISARCENTVTAFSVLNLTRKNEVTLNKQGSLFFKLARKEIIDKEKGVTSSIKRLSKNLKDAFSTTDTPFKNNKPLFKLSIPKDKEAKRQANKRKNSYNENIASGSNEDPALNYLQDHDPDYNPDDEIYTQFDDV